MTENEHLNSVNDTQEFKKYLMSSNVRDKMEREGERLNIS